MIPEAVRRLAEDPVAADPVSPSLERILTDRYCMLLGPVPSFTSIGRLRLQAGEVEETLAEIRTIVRERDHTEAKWWVGSSATPADLSARLQELGLVPDRDPHATALALVEPPPGSELEARKIETLTEFRQAMEIQHEAFDAPEHHREEWRRIEAKSWADEQAGRAPATFLVWRDGEPVASAKAVFLHDGVLLIGGATLPKARGQGAYRALVRARWDAAVAVGTPALVIHAGSMSRPIVERLGFQPVAEIDILRDPDA